MEGTNPIFSATELVNEKLTFCMHFPIPPHLNDPEPCSQYLENPLSRFRRYWPCQCSHWPTRWLLGISSEALGLCCRLPDLRRSRCCFSFLGEPVFPLRSFSPDMGSCPFRVGSKVFHQEIIGALEPNKPE